MTGRWLGLVALIGAGVAQPAQGAVKVGDCAGLNALALPHTTIDEARLVPAAAPLPAYCRVTGAIAPTADSTIGFQVAIPASGWNGRYLQVGNGGFGGTIPERAMLPVLVAGYAVAGTDDGHVSGIGTDASWALGHPEKVIDFAWRAVRETTLAGRAVVTVYTGEAPRYSYFSGCSTGGREALIQAQRFPRAFDGIVAGNPASNWTHLMTSGAWSAQALMSPGAWISPAKLPALEAAAGAKCGDRDGVIQNPLACQFDPAVIRCTGAETDQCLTDPQIAALRKIYAGPRNPRTRARILAGFDPGGEAQPGAWQTWQTGSAPRTPGQGRLMEYARNFFSYLVFGDPNYQLARLNFDTDVALADSKFAKLFNARNPNLSAFRAAGGKLIAYHGWADPAIPPRDSIAYHRSVQQRMGDTSSFYRLFMAPGMAHCGGGAGPNVLATLPAIVAWVEEGQAPDTLLAIKYAATGPGAPVERLRPLCPFPRVARWDGKGDAGKPESYRCLGGRTSDARWDGVVVRRP